MNQADVEIIDETILDEEPACEFNHNVTTCSVQVTHRVRSCSESGLLCTNAAEQLKAWMGEGRRHGACHRPCRDCFRVLPV